MRLLALVAAALLSSLVLAGCSDDNGDGDGLTSSSSSSAAPTSTSASSSSAAPSSSSSSSSAAPAPNRAPTGSISAATASGAAPLAVNFTLAGSDPDGDTLAWDLVFGDGESTNGAALPATVSHTYASVGNFTAELTLSDGEAQTSYSVTVAISEAAGGSIVLSVSGDVLANCASLCELCDPAAAAGCAPAPVLPGAFGCITFNLQASPEPLPAPAIDCLIVPLPPEAVGRTFTASSTGGDPDLDFVDICNPVDGVTTESVWNPGPETGTVPAGFACAVIWEFNPVTPDSPSTITFTVS